MRKEGFGEGGKIIGAFDRFGKKTELKYLRKWLKRDAKEAIEDFYRKAELDIKVEGLTYPMDDLDWGLEQLQGDGSLSENYEMYCGERDSLIVEKKGIQLEKVGHSLEDYISNGIWK